MEEVRVTFADTPGAAIVGDEDAVMALIVKLTEEMDMEQFAWMLLKAKYSENTGSLAGDSSLNVAAIVDILEQRLHEMDRNPPKALYIGNGKTRLYSNPT